MSASTSNNVSCHTNYTSQHSNCVSHHTVCTTQPAVTVVMAIHANENMVENHMVLSKHLARLGNQRIVELCAMGGELSKLAATSAEIQVGMRMQVKVSKGERWLYSELADNRLQKTVKQLSTEKMSGGNVWCTHTLASGSYGANAQRLLRSQHHSCRLRCACITLLPTHQY